MKVKVTTWKVSTLYKLKDKINEQPTYQRGEVWSPRKKAILIDSMLRGIDIPKIYLRKLPASNAHDYEVADGQQRLTSICRFIDNKVTLIDGEEKGLNLAKIDSKIVGGLTYSQLHQDHKDRFDGYEVTIAIIEEATHNEIRTLFGRLQEGEPLVPAEKRNAIISTVGHLIDNYAINHSFFHNSRIPDKRYKRQDYMAHALALVLYGNVSPLKAELLLEMYLDKKAALTVVQQKNIADVLDLMQKIDADSYTRIYKKYHFVDVFYHLYRNIKTLKSFIPAKYAVAYDKFEALRLINHRSPANLIENKKPSKAEKNLYDYVMAFKYNGADPSSIETRAQVFDSLF